MHPFASASLSLILLSQPRTTFPGGSIQPPPGCTAPPRIETIGYEFLGSVECPYQRLSIAVFGGGMVRPACSTSRSPATAPELAKVKLKLPNGRSITICAIERKSTKDKRQVRELIVDIGAVQLFAETRTPQDTLVLLQLAASYEPDTGALE